MQKLAALMYSLSAETCPSSSSCISLIWITCCIFHALQPSILTGFEMKENILIKITDFMYIKFLSQQTVIKNAEHHHNQAWVWADVMSTDIDTFGDILLWYVRLCLRARSGEHDVHWFAKLNLIWIHHSYIKLGICHLWSAITVHVEEVEFVNSIFHSSTLTYFEFVEESNVIQIQQVDLLFLKGKDWLSVFHGPGFLLCNVVISTIWKGLALSMLFMNTVIYWS